MPNGIATFLGVVCRQSFVYIKLTLSKSVIFTIRMIRFFPFHHRLERIPVSLSELSLYLMSINTVFHYLLQKPNIKKCVTAWTLLKLKWTESC